MDLESVFGVVREYLLPHWAFFFMSFALGTIGQFFKKKVWTAANASRGRFWKFMHATLGIHAPVAGFIAGIAGFPVSPGVDGFLARGLYHFVAGAMAAYVVAAWKHFLKSRGIDFDAHSLPPPG